MRTVHIHFRTNALQVYLSVIGYTPLVGVDVPARTYHCLYWYSIFSGLKPFCILLQHLLHNSLLCNMLAPFVFLLVLLLALEFESLLALLFYCHFLMSNYPLPPALRFVCSPKCSIFISTSLSEPFSSIK